MEKALSLLHTILSSDGGAYALITGILVLSWWATSKIATINANHGNLMKSLEKHDSFIDELRKDISYIKNDLIQVVFREGEKSLCLRKARGCDI